MNEQPNFIQPNSKEEEINNFVESIGSVLFEDPAKALDEAEKIPDAEVRAGIWKKINENEKFAKFWSNVQPLLSHEEMERIRKAFGLEENIENK